MDVVMDAAERAKCVPMRLSEVAEQIRVACLDERRKVIEECAQKAEALPAHDDFGTLSVYRPEQVAKAIRSLAEEVK